MSFRALIVILILVLASLAARAKTSEADDLTDVIDAAGSASLIFIDLGDTLVRQAQSLGTDQWYYDYVRETMELGVSEGDAHVLANDAFIGVNRATPVLPLETDQAYKIRRAQVSGKLIMGLTSRGADSADMTTIQLRALGMNLRRHHKMLLPNQKLPSGGEILDGVVYCNNMDKGAVATDVLNLLRAKGTPPLKVLFIDDKAKNIASVEKAMEKMGQPFDGYAYNAQRYKDAYGSQVAEAQFSIYQRFGRVVSDRVAARWLESNVARCEYLLKSK